MQKICQCPNLEIPIVVGNNLQTNVEMFAAHYSSGEKFFTYILSQAEKPRIHLPQGFGGRGITTPYTAYRYGLLDGFLFLAFLLSQ